MIGDAGAHGKSRKGPVAFKQKNAKGQSFKTIAPGRDDKFDTGDAGTKAAAHGSTKGMRPGHGGRDMQNPKEQRSRKLADWCMGKGDCK